MRPSSWFPLSGGCCRGNRQDPSHHLRLVDILFLLPFFLVILLSFRFANYCEPCPCSTNSSCHRSRTSSHQVIHLVSYPASHHSTLLVGDSPNVSQNSLPSITRPSLLAARGRTTSSSSRMSSRTHVRCGGAEDLSPHQVARSHQS
jgi:hypothetical protein